MDQRLPNDQPVNFESALEEPPVNMETDSVVPTERTDIQNEKEAEVRNFNFISN